MSSDTLIAQSLVRQFEDGDYLLEISQWTKEDGLPSWHIRSFIKDKRGYIWFTTDIGLVRFDGREFVRYNKKEYGFRTNNLANLAIDVNNNIWVFSFHRKEEIIDIFDPFLEKAVPIESYIGQTLPFSYEYNLGVFQHRDSIWLIDCSGYGGCYTGEWQWRINDTQKIEINKDYFRNYCPRKDKLFWLWERSNTSSKLLLIDSLGKEVFYEPFDRKGFHFSQVDDSLNMYFCVNSKKRKNPFELDTLFRFDVSGIKAFPFGEYPSIPLGGVAKSYNASFITNQEDIAIHADVEVAFFFKEEEVFFKNLSNILSTEFDTKIYDSIFLTKEGDFWFSSPAGLFRLHIKKKIFSNYPIDDETILSVRAIVGINDSQLIANTYSGMFQINWVNKTYVKLNSPNNVNNLALLKENDHLWIGKHFNDLVHYNLKTKEYKKIPANSKWIGYEGRAIYRLNDSILWVGTLYGIMQLKELYPYSLDPFCLNDTIINCFYGDSLNIWVGTNQGLIQFDKEGRIQRRFPIVNDKEEAFEIFYIHKDADGLFWLATNQGLIRWQPTTNTYDQYTTSDGLSDNTIHAVYEDSYSNLWLPSNYGLMCFRKADAYVTTYLEKDGLPSSEFNFLAHYQREDSLLFLGGVNGITSFYPNSLGISQPMPLLLQFGNIKTYNRETEFAVSRTAEAINLGGIIINPNENRLEIELVPHFLSDHKMVYQWRLPAESEKWISMRAPYLELNNPDYGNYMLEFRAYPLGSLHSQSEILSVELKVLKPFYLKWEFILLVSLGILLCIYQFILWRQRQLKARMLELEKLVNEQTEELKSKLTTINQQAKELKMIDQVKSRFFINISHELRTPLTLILGPVANLIEQPLTKNQKAQLQRIKRNAQQLRQLTEEILDLARLEVGKLELNKKNTRFDDFVKRIFGAYISLANYRGISYDLELTSPKGLRVQIDVQKTERILNNLIANALKFTSAGGRILVKVNALAENISFIIQDTGIGISPEDLPRIFDRYYQARHQNNVEKGGLGIGLAMSKELAELLGGQLWAESVLNEGTSLFFNLPIKMIDDTKRITELLKIKPHLSQQQAVTLTPPLSVDLKDQPFLLLVEDNEDLLDYLTGLLSSRFRVTQANNGLEALEKLKNNTIDLVISDVMMPEMDGFELLKQVRSEPQNWGTPFILLTARSEQEDQLYGLRLGVDAYLSKPFEQKELLARIHNLLENQKKRKKAIASINIEQSKVKDNNGAQSISFDSEWLSELEAHLKKKLTHSNLKIVDLAEDMAMSERSFRTKLKYCTGLKPNQYILEARLELAYQLLIEKRYPTVSEVIYAVGIQSKAYFSKVFKGKYGTSPSELLRKD